MECAMRIAGGILALLAGLVLVLWKAAVLVALAALGLVREGLQGADLTEAELRDAVRELRRAEVPVPPQVEDWLIGWLRDHLLAGGSVDLAPVWLGLGLAVLIGVVSVVVLFGRSRLTALLLALAGGAGLYVGLALSDDGWFSLACFAAVALGGLMAMADAGRRPPPAAPGYPGHGGRAPPPSEPPRSSRPPPPPPPPRH
jgi:hypothetical protein